MNIAIGITSASIDQRTARVWNSVLPTPMTATSPVRAAAVASRRPLPSRHSTRAATRNAAFETAFSGSAHTSGPVRSQ